RLVSCVTDRRSRRAVNFAVILIELGDRKYRPHLPSYAAFPGWVNHSPSPGHFVPRRYGLTTTLPGSHKGFHRHCRGARTASNAAWILGRTSKANYPPGTE